ncbi:MULTISPECIES: YidB family protein [unclassified Streptomyces]|uniref:YidB family protein n=1 Tax=unclassified Streptomyces TaxID=2593676 RepID=UPI0036609876
MAGNDLGSLLGGLLGGGKGGTAGGSGAGILGALLQSLAGGSGSGPGGAPGSGSAGGNPLGGLLEMLTRSGLTEQKNSWVGTGENQPVTGAQIQQAVPDETLKQVADQAGVTPDQAATQIAETLPQAVDKLSPNGRLPSASLEDLIKAQQV